MSEEHATSIWGYGLHSRRWLRGHLELRRNRLVYDITINFKRLRFTITIWRKIK